MPIPIIEVESDFGENIMRFKQNLSRLRIEWMTFRMQLGDKANAATLFNSAVETAQANIANDPSAETHRHYGSLLIEGLRLCNGSDEYERMLQLAREQFSDALALSQGDCHAMAGLAYCDFELAQMQTGSARKILLSAAQDMSIASLTDGKQYRQRVYLLCYILNALAYYLPRPMARDSLELAGEYLAQIKPRLFGKARFQQISLWLELHRLMREQSTDFAAYSACAKIAENLAAGMVMGGEMNSEHNARIQTQWVVCLVHQALTCDDDEARLAFLNKAEIKARAAIHMAKTSGEHLCNLGAVLSLKNIFAGARAQFNALTELKKILPEIKRLCPDGLINYAALLSETGQVDDAMEHLLLCADRDTLYPLDLVIHAKSFANLRDHADYPAFIETQLARLGHEWAE
ncbi:hypothetical protein [Paramylibacter kogurei]|uniref:hypothetical protein n=1 Tax=Paramylibacter kogurei TaxID=1889778 RepID=UPI001055E371|nr:hypothetical protein [Amylibacter kogurei]